MDLNLKDIVAGLEAQAEATSTRITHLEGLLQRIYPFNQTDQVAPVREPTGTSLADRLIMINERNSRINGDMDFILDQLAGVL